MSSVPKTEIQISKCSLSGCVLTPGKSQSAVAMVRWWDGSSKALCGECLVRAKKAFELLGMPKMLIELIRPPFRSWLSSLPIEQASRVKSVKCLGRDETDTWVYEVKISPEPDEEEMRIRDLNLRGLMRCGTCNSNAYVCTWDRYRRRYNCPQCHSDGFLSGGTPTPTVT